MENSVAGVALAAGAGSRLQPLTRWRPKALCPVANRPLVDLALARLRTATGDVAVNAHHGRVAIESHLATVPGGPVHLSVEEPEALGTAGALGQLRPWIAGRPTLVTNADAWLPAALDLAPFVREWDGERVRLLCVGPDPLDPDRGDFGARRYCGVALLPWRVVRDLAAEPSGLYEVSWGREWAAGRLELVDHDGPFIDCGTPRDYLRANLAASHGAAVVDPDAHVHPHATVRRSVVWAGATVTAGEVLADAVVPDSRNRVLIRG